jgi:hypothetical protein
MGTDKVTGEAATLRPITNYQLPITNRQLPNCPIDLIDHYSTIISCFKPPSIFFSTPVDSLPAHAK